MKSPPSDRFTAQQHQILNRWRDVLDDIRHLCEGLKAVPQTCACGDGPAHLRGSCPCCRGEGAGRGLPPCEDCESLLSRLQTAVDQLAVDTWQFFPSALEFLDLRERHTAKVAVHGVRERHLAAVAREDAVGAIERHIAAVTDMFERLVAAVDQFRAGCRAAHLQALKTVTNDLLVEVERFDRAL